MFTWFGWFRRLKPPPERWIHTPDGQCFFTVRGDGDSLEVLHRGPSGDKKWHGLKESLDLFDFDSEKEKLLAAIEHEKHE